MAGRHVTVGVSWQACYSGCVMVGVSILSPRGNFCAVFKCTEKTTDYVYVAKVLSVEGGRPDPMGELEMLRDLVHPRVMTLEDAYRNEDQLILLLE